MSMRISWDEAIKRGLIKGESIPKIRTSWRDNDAFAALGKKAPASDAPPEKKKRRNDWEGKEQAHLILEFAQKHPELANRLIHIPNGGFRTKTERWVMSATGVRKGVPDLLLPVARKGFHSLWIEFKASAPHSAPVTKDQQEWLDFLNKEGHSAHLAEGWPEAMTIIDQYLS